MAKEPERRYATAQDLADDLGRFLDDRPIVARRPGPVERHRRDGRDGTGVRQPRLSRLSIVLTLVSAAGMAVLWREQRLTKLALETARHSQAGERQALKFTFTASDQITSRALAMIAARQSSAEREREQDFYRKALAFYEEITSRYDGDPEMSIIAAAAGHRVGFVQTVLKDTRAEAALRRSIAIYHAAHKIPAFTGSP